MKISVKKSIISNTGAAEFAKRFRVKNMIQDLSPVSVRALCNFFNPFGQVALGLK